MRTKFKLKDLGVILKDAFKDWNEDDAFTHAAAVSYYAIFSLPAILILVINIAGMIWSKSSMIRLLVGPEEDEILASSFPFLSLLPITDQVSGVTLTGFLYPLHQATLRRGDTLGISNELTGPWGKIAIAKGKLLVIESMD